MIEQKKLRFSGHETFPLRYPWLAKGIRGVLDDPDLFSRDDALVTLGVGKNMVRSIRHWSETLSFIERTVSNGHHMRPTVLGKRLFEPDGWDPFLEYPGTLWLIHWLLVKKIEKASAWFLLFTQFNFEQFTKEQIVNWLLEVADASNTRVSPPSVKRDVDVLMRTYIPSQASKVMALEETFDSPLVELGIIDEIDSGVFSFVKGPKPSLPREIFQFALVEYWADNADGRESLSFENILYGPGSPGGAFKLSENALAELLDNLPGKSGFSFDETAGMRMLFGKPDISQEGRLSILKKYYVKTKCKAVSK